jgi:hypothetical protein
VLGLAVDNVHEVGLNEPPLPPSLHEIALEGGEGELPVSVTVAVRVTALPAFVDAGFGATAVAVGEVEGAPLTA